MSYLLCPEYPDGLVIAGCAELLTSGGVVYVKDCCCVTLMDVYHLLLCVQLSYVEGVNTNGKSNKLIYLLISFNMLLQ